MSNSRNKLPRVIINPVHDALRAILSMSGMDGIHALYSLRRASVERGYAMDRRSARILYRAELVSSVTLAPDDRATVHISVSVSTIAAVAIRIEGPTVTVRSLNEVLREIGE